MATGSRRGARRRPGRPAGERFAEELLAARLRRHRSRLLAGEGGVRGGSAESVHRMRVAVRRLRSVVSTFEPLLEPGSVDGIRADLRWLGLALGPARDALVLRERFARGLASLGPDLDVGDLAASLDAMLGAAADEGAELACRALESDRYRNLLLALDHLVEAPPVRPRAHQPARRVLPRLLLEDARRARRAADRAARSDPAERDERMHELRKRVKRLRYAAETTRRVHPGADRIVRRARAVQEALGDRQDAVIARRELQSFASLAHEDGRDASTHGALQALEDEALDRADTAFAAAWARLDRALRALDDDTR